MVNNGPAGEVLSEAGIRLRRGETALAAVELGEDGNRNGCGNRNNRNCLVLTNQRMFYIVGLGAEAQSNSTPLQDVGHATMARRHRYLGFLLAAAYFLVIGVAYLVATAVAGAFQAIVLIPTLLFGGGFLAMWWYSGGELAIRVKLGDSQLECSIGKEQEREASVFLERLAEVKGEGA